MTKIASPYRTPAEREPEPEQPREWGPIIFGGVIITALIGSLSLSIHGCKQKEAEDIQKAAQEAEMKKNRANTCGFIDVERGFRIDSYDGEGNGRIEGFFNTRKEADDFKDNLPRCKGK